MGACLSCFPNQFFGHEYWQPSESSDGWRRRRCCGGFRFFRSCCGMYEALFQASEEEEQDGTPTSSGAHSQSGGHVDETSRANSISIVHNAHANTRSDGMMSDFVRHDKAGTNLRTQSGDMPSRNGSGSGWHGGPLLMERPKVNNYSGDQKLRDKVSKLPPLSKRDQVEAVTSLLDDEDICPTCLDGYDRDNPKIMTKCGHHFHLACIYEWMERSNRCPICDQEMVFNESV